MWPSSPLCSSDSRPPCLRLLYDFARHHFFVHMPDTKAIKGIINLLIIMHVDVTILWHSLCAYESSMCRGGGSRRRRR